MTSTTPRPTAVGYVSASDPEVLDAQRHAVTEYARVEGFALAQIVTDRFDGFTLSQVVQAARLHEARLVIVPADTTLATAHARLVHELEPDGAACTVIDASAAAAVQPRTDAVAPRLTDALRPRTARHAARTTQ
ncbi:hypothetical protein [Myceligenerans pegani]|uniref:Resolvase/invertase-type recombinase catalytic domain-containing protein n=1 Tax=Myceligenerans pegani TaxID=2776917 RepID=A0ABR9MST4_9MICO|nr:hypothetical protein [Myceligenerans sp. TRM 65318]MBE1874443.1 hypothetical protein [Myceligenerans sp. TRM 65318]MBE3016714.1 hypothetical protein [Myceligenerans sp. TRM 65318]